MESTNKAVEVYQLRIWIRRISPQIWRRLLVRNDSTIAELHDTLQVVFGWSDEHLHPFLIRGKPYGIGRMAVLQKLTEVTMSVKPYLLLSLGRHSKQAGDEHHLPHAVPFFDTTHLPFPYHVHDLISL